MRPATIALYKPGNEGSHTRLKGVGGVKIQVSLGRPAVRDELFRFEFGFRRSGTDDA